MHPQLNYELAQDHIDDLIRASHGSIRKVHVCPKRYFFRARKADEHSLRGPRESTGPAAAGVPRSA